MNTSVVRMWALSAALAVSACATWESVPEDPRSFIERERPGPIVVVPHSAPPVRLRGPTVEGDHVVGERWGTRGVQLSFPLEAIEDVLSRDFHPGRTLALVLVPSVVIFALAFEAAWGA